MTKEGYDTYVMYLALQRHFSTDYDFFKYNGKVRASKDAYTNRQDAFSFEKITRIIPQKDRLDFFVAHFIEQPKEWVRNMSKAKWEKYKATYQHLPQKFREDLEYIKMVGPAQMIKYEGDIPKIHQDVLNDRIAKESVILLNMLFPFIEKNEKEVDISFVWPDYLRSVKKYQPFVELKVKDSYNTYNEIAKDVLL